MDFYTSLSGEEQCSMEGHEEPLEVLPQLSEKRESCSVLCTDSGGTDGCCQPDGIGTSTRD